MSTPRAAVGCAFIEYALYTVECIAAYGINAIWNCDLNQLETITKGPTTNVFHGIGYDNTFQIAVAIESTLVNFDNSVRNIYQAVRACVGHQNGFVAVGIQKIAVSYHVH